MSSHAANPQNGAGDDRLAAFVQLLTGEQTKLLAYISMLLGDPHEAQNVLQETNLVLWKKSQDFTAGTNFSAWSKKVAYWQVQAFVRDHKRDRHVFDEELAEQLSSIDVSETVGPEVRVALRHCVAGIRETHQRMLTLRYEKGLSIRDLAEEFKKSQSSIKVGLLRIRRALLACIQQKIAQGSGLS